MNSSVGKVVLLEFICNLCSQILLNFRAMKLQGDMEVICEALPTTISGADLTTKGILFP